MQNVLRGLIKKRSERSWDLDKYFHVLRAAKHSETSKTRKYLPEKCVRDLHAGFADFFSGLQVWYVGRIRQKNSNPWIPKTRRTVFTKTRWTVKKTQNPWIPKTCCFFPKTQNRLNPWIPVNPSKHAELLKKLRIPEPLNPWVLDKKAFWSCFPKTVVFFCLSNFAVWGGLISAFYHHSSDAKKCCHRISQSGVPLQPLQDHFPVVLPPNERDLRWSRHITLSFENLIYSNLFVLWEIELARPVFKSENLGWGEL